MTDVSWVVEFHPACEVWANTLAQRDAEALLAALHVLGDQGPNLGRPLVDTVKGSRHPSMKELRPGSTGRTEIRVLFAFDKERKAILLLGGDKSGNWQQWYRANIPVADDRFDRHQAEIVRSRTSGKPVKSKTRKREGPAMSLKQWEKKVLGAPGAAELVDEIEDELRLAAGLTALREQAGLSQRQLARRIGISQPRIAAIEQSRNITIEVLEQYVHAVGGRLEVNVVKGKRKIPLLRARPDAG